MASIRQMRGKWQVLIRRKFAKHITKSFVLKSDAEKYAREKEAQIDKGFLVSYEEAQKTKLGELLERYRTEITSKKKSNETEDFKIKYLQTLPICDIYLISITPTKIAKLRDALLADRKPGTVCKYLAFISNCWNVARKEWGINLPDNPVSLIKKPIVKDRRDRILTPEEYKRLLDACSLSKLYSMKGMVIFAYTTSARYGEILKLQKKDVDFIKRTAILRDTKNNEDRVLPLTEEAIQVLKDQPLTTSGHFFQASNDKFKHYWNKAKLIAGVENFRFHDLRACAITNFFLPPYNFQIPTVAKISGHKSWKELERYERMKPNTVVDRFIKLKK
jgi:integrase